MHCLVLKGITGPFPCFHPILFQGRSAFCKIPSALTQMTALGKSTALRLSCSLAGRGKECACLAFVQESLDSTPGPGEQGARVGTGWAPRPCSPLSPPAARG